MGFSTAQGSSVHTQCVLKIENSVSCDMNLEEALEQTAQITSHRSFLGLGAKSSFSLRSYNKEKIL